MKTYLVLAFSAPGHKPTGGGSMEDWKVWSEEYEDKIVDMGAPLSSGVEGSGKDGFSLIKEDQWPAQGYMMIQADDIEKAQEIMSSSPLGAEMPLRIFEKAEMPDMS